MIRDLLKWVAPGVVTVLGGTVAALAMATPTMLDALAEEGRVSLKVSGSSWAHIDLAGRRVHLTGTTSSDTERDLAVASLLALRGISSVDETVTIAPLAAPYRINVSVEDGAVSLFGSVPNEELRQSLLALPDLATVDLQVRSGQPDETLWRRGVDFALAQATLVDSGYFELSGLTLNAVGRASSEKALGHLQMALTELPSGIASGEISVEPVRVAPYTWRAEFDGSRIAISGHVPEERLVDRLRLADVAGVPIATGLSLASGAPEGFAERTRLLVEQLARLERGAAEIVDGVSHLTGVPPTVEVAQAITEALSGTDSIVTLSPPRVADYWVSINRQPGGVLVFDGFVPDEATRESFAAIPGADASFLKYGAGAPEGYRRGVDFGLEVLGYLSEGRVALTGEVITVSGLARSPTDYRAVHELLKSGVPQGLTLGQSGVAAPRAANYVFSARQDAAGGIVLEGMLPDPQVETALLARAGTAARSRVSFASGETPNFLASAEQALDFLPWMRRGSVRFDGTGWTVEGEPASAIDKASIETEFAVRGLAQAGWSLALSQPIAAPDFADPYLWSAERLPDGSFLFAGNVPAAALQSYLKVHAGTRVTDTSRVANGAPEGFAADVRAAVDALLGLEQGRAAYDGKTWSLTGAAADTQARDAVLALAANLNLPESAEISLPEVVPSEPYYWAATKAQDGTVALKGSVPAESLQRFLAVRAGTAVTDGTVLRADAPDGFAADVLQAMDILALVSEGEVAFDGDRWSAEGTAITPDANADATTLLGTAAPRWTLSLVQPAAPPAEVVAEVAAPEAPAPSEPAAPAEPAPPVAAPQAAPDYAFVARRAADGAVTLSGQVPAQSTARYLATLSGSAAENLEIVPGAPDTFVQDAQAGIRALLQLQQGQLELADGAWSLMGDAKSPADKAALDAQIAALGGQWSVDIAAPSGLAQCRESVAALSDHNAILFQSGAAIIAASASAELDAFADALRLCPDAIVEVEGHTDSDGDDQLNLALSVARAEAVVNALIERDIAPIRLYAIGYGETQPVADNDTSEGKRRNRRIVVSVRDPGEQG
ncbi:OmpA family protein [Devosia sp. XJ19-1]|uniref:OmpA family protein n=1 Tax=Devosia ureilytica TaxID=2952754 RepID=A0A9Q4FQV9_9HYPH|nr:OmpA family protein [Devosia ureilytica]MCP8882535.1 OmpA family protein [Devosia ureilytica]MCP8885578.1 OmpA family protein [Devosia ureilytica]